MPTRGAADISTVDLESQALECLLDCLPPRITVWSADLRLLYANRAMERLTGQPRSNLVGRPMDELTDRLSNDEMAPYLTAVLAGVPQRWQGSTMTPGGDLVHVTFLLEPLRRDGALDGFTLVCLDMTAQKHHELAIRQYDVQFASACEQLRLVASLSGPVVQRIREQAGVLRTVLSVPEEDAPETSAALGPDIVAELGEVIEFLRYRLTGVLAESVTIDRDLTSVPLTIRLADPTRFSPRGEAETACGLDAEQLRTVLDSLPFAVSAWDADHVNTFANAAERAAFEIEQPVGRSARQLYHDDHVETCGPIADAAIAGVPQWFLRRTPAPDGGVRTAEVDYLPAPVLGRGADGGPDLVPGFVACIMDVTGRVRAEEALAAATSRLSLQRRRRADAELLLDPMIQTLFAVCLRLGRRSGLTAPGVVGVVADLEGVANAWERTVSRFSGARLLAPMSDDEAAHLWGPQPVAPCPDHACPAHDVCRLRRPDWDAPL